ncbi:M14 family zinc carboxypeptidase [Granulicella aggregans]|uniref:M14 family zinc carboxypeptidase n=1 Tax=Granulicella aggregans TaxID=474949 RepID=UPI0021E04D45|nr:M14 family zinc carboxypeptidase [Granulicella aggregans]
MKPLLLVAALLSTSAFAQSTLNDTFARDPHQPIDDAYTAKIHEYTTDPHFTSHLVDYLPASKTVPTPEKVLGNIAGAPDMLPYAEDVYKYMRLLEASSPRVKVTTIGHSEEGREMIAVAVADEALLKTYKENEARLAKLADPRTIGLDDAKAKPLIDASYPVYYITGTIHSPETGAPTALMELAYRLAVDDSPYIKYIRSHMVVLITPVVEVDGRDRMVDLYRWHKAHPGQIYPRLPYWGHYVAHDNNRDAMGMTLNLTRNVLNAYIDNHAQVLHDLHESVPFLYDNTVGDGPYNAWIDPLLADEWADLAWNNVAQMQSFAMPGVFTHGDFDTWSPGYLMFLAGLHNGISRLYETFGNGGADTEKRILDPEEYSRTWYRQNPPQPVVTWSQRDNNNYEESALLSTISYFSHNTHHFLENYYLKSKRSVLKPTIEGPSAYILPASPEELNRQLQLLSVMQLQHVEISQLSEPVTVAVPVSKKSEKPSNKTEEKPEEKPEADTHNKTEEKTFPAGSYVIRLDQPYSRIADALLDKQYWAPDDPQKHPYDDTGWSFSQLFNVKSFRVVDPVILKSKMSSVTDLSAAAGNVTGTGTIYAIANTGQTSLLALLYAAKSAHVESTEKSFDSEGHSFPAGSLLISSTSDTDLSPILKKLSLNATKLADKPSVATHPVAAPRVAFMHTWLGTQTEGWWRLAFDKAGVPFSYINTQTVSAEEDLRGKYDVIVFAPVGRASAQQIIDGVPINSATNPMPWQKTDLTPNMGLLDSTADMRPGLGYTGLAHLKDFVAKGGLLITCEDTAQFAAETGLAPGVSIASTNDVRVTGTVLSSVFVSTSSPIAYGYGKTLPVMSANGMAFNVSNTYGRAGGRTLFDPYESRPTGRGGPDESDTVQGRVTVDPVILPKQQPWQPRPLNEEQMRNNPQLIPAAQRPEVILRFNDGKNLLLSGLLDKSGSIAERAIVIDAHLGTGNVLLFANNPVYRGETIGSYNLVFNAIMNFDHLNTPAK